MVIDHMYKRFFLRFVILHRTFTIPIKFLTKHVKPLHSLLCVCVYVYVYVCVSVCVYVYLHDSDADDFSSSSSCSSSRFLSSSVICVPVYFKNICQLKMSNIHVLKNQGGDIARSE